MTIKLSETILITPLIILAFSLEKSKTVSIEDSVMYLINRNNFDILVEKNPKALLPILKVLTGRLRETMDFLKQRTSSTTKNNSIKMHSEPINAKLTTY